MLGVDFYNCMFKVSLNHVLVVQFNLIMYNCKISTALNDGITSGGDNCMGCIATAATEMPELLYNCVRLDHSSNHGQSFEPPTTSSFYLSTGSTGSNECYRLYCLGDIKLLIRLSFE